MSKSLRSQLYRGARDLGNVEAATHGDPLAGTAKRIGRRCVIRNVNQTCSHRICRAIGVWR
jgi:hypothetical protein